MNKKDNEERTIEDDVEEIKDILGYGHKKNHKEGEKRNNAVTVSKDNWMNTAEEQFNMFLEGKDFLTYKRKFKKIGNAIQSAKDSNTKFKFILLPSAKFNYGTIYANVTGYGEDQNKRKSAPINFIMNVDATLISPEDNAPEFFCREALKLLKGKKARCYDPNDSLDFTSMLNKQANREVRDSFNCATYPFTSASVGSHKIVYGEDFDSLYYPVALEIAVEDTITQIIIGYAHIDGTTADVLIDPIGILKAEKKTRSRRFNRKFWLWLAIGSIALLGIFILILPFIMPYLM